MMMTETPPLLCINLRAATQRWSHLQHEASTHMPGAMLKQIDAVDWRTLPVDMAQLPITLFSRYLLTFPEKQSKHRVSHRQIDTLSTVAIFMSHMKCWKWLVNHPNEKCALVLEDDACFDPTFKRAWEHTIRPLLDHTEQWDILVLVFFATVGPETIMYVPGTHPPLSTMVVSQFFGAHAYLVTQRGATILLNHSLPLDHQVDGLFLTLHELGLLRLRMLRASVVSQCIDAENREGSWHTHSINSSRVVSTEHTLQTWQVFAILGLVAAVAGWYLWLTSSSCTDYMRKIK